MKHGICITLPSDKIIAWQNVWHDEGEGYFELCIILLLCKIKIIYTSTDLIFYFMQPVTFLSITSILLEEGSKTMLYDFGWRAHRLRVEYMYMYM